MTMKIVIIIGVMLMWFTSMTVSTYAITNSTSNVGTSLESQIKELRVNPYFAPDESCMFDAFQLHCIPGEDQTCPKGYGNNDANTCFLLHRSGCPEGYYGMDDDETGQCYPDKQPCYPGDIRYPSDRADKEACGDVQDICEKYNASLSESCMVNGRTIIDYPDASCLNNPDADKCNVLEGYGCPLEIFTMMTSRNFTTPKCVPLSYEEALLAGIERGILDPNRCKEGYKLANTQAIEPYSPRFSDKPIGQCVKL